VRNIIFMSLFLNVMVLHASLEVPEQAAKKTSTLFDVAMKAAVQSDYKKVFETYARIQSASDRFKILEFLLRSEPKDFPTAELVQLGKLVRKLGQESSALYLELDITPEWQKVLNLATPPVSPVPAKGKLRQEREAKSPGSPTVFVAPQRTMFPFLAQEQATLSELDTDIKNLVLLEQEFGEAQDVFNGDAVDRFEDIFNNFSTLSTEFHGKIIAPSPLESDPIFSQNIKALEELHIDQKRYMREAHERIDRSRQNVVKVRELTKKIRNQLVQKAGVKTVSLRKGEAV
jgi:hypothetical protein